MPRKQFRSEQIIHNFVTRLIILQKHFVIESKKYSFSKVDLLCTQDKVD